MCCVLVPSILKSVNAVLLLISTLSAGAHSSVKRPSVSSNFGTLRCQKGERVDVIHPAESRFCTTKRPPSRSAIGPERLTL